MEATETDINHLLHSFEPDDDRVGKGRFLTRREMEKQHIEGALKHCRGIVGGKHGAARLLGIPRTTLQYRMKKLGIRNRVLSNHRNSSRSLTASFQA